MDVLQINNTNGVVKKYKGLDPNTTKGAKQKYVFSLLIRFAKNPSLKVLVHRSLINKFGTRSSSATYKIIDRTIKRYSRWLVKGYRNISSNGVYLIRYLMVFILLKSLRSDIKGMYYNDSKYTYWYNGKVIPNSQMSNYNQYLSSLINL